MLVQTSSFVAAFLSNLLVMTGVATKVPELEVAGFCPRQSLSKDVLLDVVVYSK